jgi:hypothetical protein
MFGIPVEQVIPLANFIGLGILGLVGAFGLWWGQRKKTPGERTLEVAAALVDGEAVRLLAAAIEAHTVEMIASRHEAEKARALGYRLVEAVPGIAGELEELRRNVGELANQIARKK